MSLLTALQGAWFLQGTVILSACFSFRFLLEAITDLALLRGLMLVFPNPQPRLLSRSLRGAFVEGLPGRLCVFFC